MGAGRDGLIEEAGLLEAPPAPTPSPWTYPPNAVVLLLSPLALLPQRWVVPMRTCRRAAAHARSSARPSAMRGAGATRSPLR